MEPPADEAKPQPVVVHDQRARVEVYNAAGKPGLARIATEQLRDAGFDVVQFGNANETKVKSEVIDRMGRTNVALDVAKALGVAQVKTAIDTTRYVDVTVLLGKDWSLKRN